MFEESGDVTLAFKGHCISLSWRFIRAFLCTIYFLKCCSIFWDIVWGPLHIWRLSSNDSLNSPKSTRQRRLLLDIWGGWQRFALRQVVIFINAPFQIVSYNLSCVSCALTSLFQRLPGEYFCILYPLFGTTYRSQSICKVKP